MAAGKRSPTAHRTPAQIKAHGRGYQAQPDQVKKRTARNAARAEMIKAGKASKGDGKDVGHKIPKNKSELTFVEAFHFIFEIPTQNRALLWEQMINTLLDMGDTWDDITLQVLVKTLLPKN